MESRRVQAGDVGLQYFEEGAGAETVVLVHGFASNAAIWRYTIEGLADTGRFRVIALNNRGAGESDRSEMESDYSVESFAEDLYNVVCTLGLSRFTLVGHSMGGATVTKFALEHQGLLKALVLLNSTPLKGRTPVPNWEQELRESFAAGGQTQGDMGFNAAHVTQDFIDEVLGVILRNPIERAIGGRRSMFALQLREGWVRSKSRHWWWAVTGTTQWGWTTSSPSTLHCRRGIGICTFSTESATRRTWKCRDVSPGCWPGSLRR